MRTQRSQFGITFLGFVIIIIVGSFFAYAAMKLVPIYNEYFSVVKAMNVVKREPGVENKSIEEIRRMLDVQFDLQYVNQQDVPPTAISLSTANGQRNLKIAYTVDVEFLYNVDLLVKFEKTLDLTSK